MSWLIVAKIPLLISSRMTSATFTPSRSASSLTMIVDGSSIAPRSFGSATWTAVVANAPSRRGGLRGPRRPRVPLLLRATHFLLDDVRVRCPRERRPKLWRERGSERLRECARCGGRATARSVVMDIRAASGELARRIDDDRTGRRSNDPHELSLRLRSPAHDAGPRRNGAADRCLGAAYDDAPFVDAAARDLRAGAAVAPSAAWESVPFVDASALALAPVPSVASSVSRAPAGVTPSADTLAASASRPSSVRA